MERIRKKIRIKKRSETADSERLGCLGVSKALGPKGRKRRSKIKRENRSKTFHIPTVAGGGFEPPTLGL